MRPQIPPRNEGEPQLHELIPSQNVAPFPPEILDAEVAPVPDFRGGTLSARPRAGRDRERLWQNRGRLEPSSRGARSGGPVVVAVAAAAALAASFGVIGADALWLVPLGSQVAHGHLPGSIGFATAPTNGWHNVPAAAELLFWGAWHAFGGGRGLVVWQALGAAGGVGALACGRAREA